MRGNVPATMKALVAYSAADYRFEQAFPVPSADRTTSLSKPRAAASAPAT